MRIYIKNLASCRARVEKTNQYASYAQNAGHEVVKYIEDADTILLWTCAFREDFKSSSLAKIAEYLENTDANLLICGCLLDIDRNSLPQNNSRVQLIQWKNENSDIKRVLNSQVEFSSFIEPLAELKICDDATEYRKSHPESAAMFADQFNKLIISSGCNFSCSYCSEKLVFPPYSSHSPKALCAKAKELYLHNNVKDFMLMADSLGQYGSDIGYSLTMLLDYIREEIPGARFALNNVNPTSLLEDFANFERLIQEGALYHLNLPIQTASDPLLRLMGRTYTQKDLAVIYDMLRRHNFARHDTHLLIGFPQETELDVTETIAFLQSNTPSYILLSRFMPCKGTPAAAMDGHVADPTAYGRIERVVEAMEPLGVICNYDNSEISITRRHRLAIDT